MEDNIYFCFTSFFISVGLGKLKSPQKGYHSYSAREMTEKSQENLTTQKFPLKLYLSEQEYECVWWSQEYTEHQIRFTYNFNCFLEKNTAFKGNINRNIHFFGF